MTISGALKWHGGKSYLAPMIHSLATPHIHRVIPFAGGMGELWGWDCEGVSEVVNDINFDLSNFWGVLQEKEAFEQFLRVVQATPFSLVEFVDADLEDQVPNPRAGWARIERAVAFFISVRQSMAGRMKCFSPLSRTRTRRGMNEQASAWWNAIDGLPDVHSRLARVVILNDPAIRVIRSQDGPGTLFYCDPPYVPSTRTAPDVYRHEMTIEEHAELLTVLKDCEGHVMLSGYRCDLYDTELAGWRREDLELPNASGSGKVKQKRIESIWMNYE
jgi:DNA adenine methylase